MTGCRNPEELRNQSLSISYKKSCSGIRSIQGCCQLWVPISYSQTK